MVRLHNPHAAAARLAATAPEVLTHPKVTSAIEQEVVWTLIACLATAAKAEEPNPSRQHIMQKFGQVIEAIQDEPLYTAEICAAVGVPERTLYATR